MTDQTITAQGTKALQAMQQSRGHFFNVKFIKKDGSVRTMQARLGVKKFHKGGANTVAHISKYLTVYENGTKPKNVNLNEVLEVTVNKQTLKIA